MTDLEFSIFAELRAGLGALAEDLQENSKLRRAAQAEIPVDRPLFSSGITPSSGILVLDFGGPDMGKRWLVRAWRVGGLTPTTAVNGASARADLFIGVAPPGTNITGGRGGGDNFTVDAYRQGVMQDWRDAMTTFPQQITYSARACVCGPNEGLFVALPNWNATQNAIGTALVEEYTEEAYKIRFGV